MIICNPTTVSMKNVYPSFKTHVVRALFFLFALSGSYTSYTQTFGNPIPVVNRYTVAGGNAGQFTDLKAVRDTPAVCYYDATRKALCYMRAANAFGTTFNGTNWNSSKALDSIGDVGQYLSFQVVGGNPAVSYYDAINGDLKFIRANDVAGRTWAAPQTLVSAGDVGKYTSLQVVMNIPCISYYNATTDQLFFISATDANATGWNTPVAVNAPGNGGMYSSLQQVNGRAAIAWYDNVNLDLKFAQAATSDGSTWPAAQTLDNVGDVGKFASLLLVRNNPAISYYDAANGDLKYIKATNVNGNVWNAPVTVDAGGNVGQYTSLQYVNGNPSISYYDATNQDLKFVRATDVDGAAWSTAPLRLDQTGNVGLFTSLTVITGNPAIAYYDGANGDVKYIRSVSINGTDWTTAPLSRDVAGVQGTWNSLQMVGGYPALTYYDITLQRLKYVRATDVNGLTWGNPFILDNTRNAGQYSSLQMVDGLPAVSYYDHTSNDLRFVRASSLSGLFTIWQTPAQALDQTGDVGLYTSLKVIGGNPAIAYYDATNADLKYVRATNTTGTAWSAPVTVDAPGNVGKYAALLEINGNPAIAYYDETNGDLKYAIAADANGTAWAVQAVDAAGTVGLWTTLQLVDGNPAVAYYDTNGLLKYVRATDATGTTWGIAAVADAAGNVGQQASLQVVNGNPAISYYDATNGNLKFVRATNSTGTVWAAPQVLHSFRTTGMYTSMITRGNGAAIAYYAADEALPYFISSVDFPLPVTLTSFGARWKNETVQLDWTVVEESNIKGYVVERSNDGRNFSKLGAITALNGTGRHQYSYIDAAPLEGTNFYRLLKEEIAGTSSYSAIVSLKSRNQPAQQQVRVYPNPVKNGLLQFETNLPAGKYQLQVMNSAGVQVMLYSYQQNGGTAVQTISVGQQLTGGIYHVVISGEGVKVGTTFVK